MKSFIQTIILIHCAIFGLSLAHSQSLEYQVKVSYPEKDPRLEITVVVGKEQKENINYYKNLTLESVRIVEEIFKVPFKDDFSLVFDPRQDYHNGLTTVIPSNRAYVYTEVPDLGSSIGLVRQAHLETTVHELAHMIMIQQRKGFFIPFSWVVGNLSRPNALFPRWVHEGMAVWAESHLGGRGHSGLIQSEIKKYAEIYQRNNKHPLRSDMMDGSLELNAMSQGNVPYHFGYLLIDDLLKDKYSKTAGELVVKSSYLPGWFFHRLFTKNGKRMTDRFNVLREEWAKTPIEKTPEREVLSKSKTITGPFVSGNGLSWFDKGSDKPGNTTPRVFLEFSDENGKKIKTKFARGGSHILQAFWNSELNAWVLLAYSLDLNTNHLLRKRIILVSESGGVLCENTDIERIREIALDGSTLAWIRSDELGHFFFEKSKLNNECKISNVEKVYSSGIAFERLSHPWIKGTEWLLSKGHGADLSHDAIFGSENFQLEPSEGAFAYPQYITVNGKKSLLVTWYKENYRGPALVDLATKKIKTFAIQTEAPASYGIDGKEFIYARNAYWDNDIIHKVSVNETSPVERKTSSVAGTQENKKVTPKESQATKTEDSKKAEATTSSGSSSSAALIANSSGQVQLNNDNNKEIEIPDLDKKTGNEAVENYGTFPSIFPRFWYPNVQTYDRGTQVTGSTFFSDLSDEWRGLLIAGFDSGASRPMGYLDITKDRLGLGIVDQWEFQGLSNFRYIGNEVQDIQIVRTQFRLAQRLGTRFVAALLPGVEYRRGSEIRYFKSYSVVAPSLSFLFASPHAKNVKDQSYQITDFGDAFYLNANMRWLPQTSYEVYSNYQGKIKSVGYLLGIEYGYTPPETFPVVYYEWGGRPDFSTLDTSYLSRGFPTNRGPSLQILRANFEFGFKVWSFQKGLAWNRLHLSDIEFRPLYEVITTDLYQPTVSGNVRKTSVRMGNDYFQTVGAELDFFFQALHYADFKASFGYFHGMGNGSQDNFGFKLVTMSDFF